MFELLLLPLFFAFVLTVWFDTDAFIEYSNLLKIRIPVVKRYNQIIKTGISISFIDYLVQFENSFLTRLVTCPICLSAWFGIVSILPVMIVSFLFSSLFGIFGLLYCAAIPYLTLFLYKLNKKLK